MRPSAMCRRLKLAFIVADAPSGGDHGESLTRSERGNAATDVQSRDGGSSSWSEGNRVRPLVHGATYFARLQEELAHAKSALEDRKVIDRAKGVLMKMKNLTEEEAYALLRKTAMNEKRKIADVAQSVVTAAELFK